MARARIGTALALISLITAVGVPRATAQTETPSASLRLLSQPPWHSAGDSLDFRLAIENTSPQTLPGFQVTIAAHPQVRTRSALHAAFEGNPGLVASSFIAADRTEDELDAGESTEIAVRDVVEESLDSLAAVSEGGVYPVTISLYDSSGIALLDSIITSLLFYPQEPEVPLGIALIVPLGFLPSRGPDGNFAAVGETSPLEDSLAPGGALRGLLTALDRATTPPPPPPPRAGDRGRRRARRESPPQEPVLRIGIAPVPRTLEEIADIANGYRRAALGAPPEQIGPNEPGATQAAEFISDLREITARPGVQLILTPYAFPDLPSLSLEQVSDQIQEAEDVLARVLLVNAGRGWVYPPAGRLDATTIGELRSLQAAEHTFFSPDALVGASDPTIAGCPEPTLSFTCPVRVETAQGPTIGYTFDEDVQQRMAQLVKSDEPTLALQNVLAETAMIHGELPGTPGRILEMSIPVLWQPAPWLARRLIEAIRRAPWLEAKAPGEGLVTAARPAAREAIPIAPELPEDVGTDILDRSLQADEVVSSFATVLPEPDDPLLRRLRRNLLVAQSRMWSSEVTGAYDALDFIEETEAEAGDQLSAITVGGADEITFTSRRGDIQLQLFNDNDYPVNVVVHLESTKLALDRSEFEQRLGPRSARTLQLEATAQASGEFPLSVQLETPDGRVIAERIISIRSTEFNVVAIAITAGALVFLVAFYLLRGVRRRGAQPA